MKLDMHCHVKEGSIDSKVSLDEYITLLKERGFDGMLITDHDTTYFMHYARRREDETFGTPRSSGCSID